MIWRKRLGVEPSLPREGAATGFEDREGHRAPVASTKDHTCAAGDDVSRGYGAVSN